MDHTRTTNTPIREDESRSGSSAWKKPEGSRKISLQEPEDTSPGALPGGYQLQSPGARAVAARRAGAAPDLESQAEPTASPDAEQPEPTPQPSLQTTQKSAPTMPVATPRFASSNDPDFISVSLPSQFYWYPFKELGVRSMKVTHQAKFAKASKARSTRLTVEAISALLGDGINAMDMTISDVKYVMYFLRQQNFKAQPMHVTGLCDSSKHLDDVAEEKVGPETLSISATVTVSQLRETPLDVEAVDKFLGDSERLASLNALGFTLTAPRYFDTVELEEKFLVPLLEANAPQEDIEDVEFIGDRASCLVRLDGQPSTLEERMKITADLSMDDSTLIRDFLNLIGPCGVDERVIIPCKTCGAKVVTPVTIAAHSFL